MFQQAKTKTIDGVLAVTAAVGGMELFALAMVLLNVL